MHIMWCFQDGDGLDTSCLQEVLCKRNKAHLQAVKEEYEKLSGHKLESDVQDATSGDAETAYIDLS